MRKRIILLIVALVSMVSVAAQNDSSVDDDRVDSVSPVIAPENYDTGGLITHPDGGASGSDESRLQTQIGLAIIGYDASATSATRIADDFSVSGVWTLDYIKLYAYQLNALTTGSATINAATLRIWDGPPGAAGSTVIFGDTLNNRLLFATWADVFRACEGFIGSCQPGSTVRPVQALFLDVFDGNDALTLSPGTYWWDVQLAGDGGLPVPRLVPLSAVDAYVQGNAQRLIGQNWEPVVDDAGIAVQQGFPMEISYTANDTNLFSRIAPVGTVNTTPLTLEVTDGGLDWLRVTITQSTPTGEVPVSDAWYPAADYCDSLACELPAPILTNGAYNWSMQGWESTSGLTGQDTTTFTVAAPAVGHVQPQYPVGAVGGAPIAIIFGQDTAAAWYHVYISGSGGFVFNQWVAATDVCGTNGTRCIIEAPPMAAGEYQMWLGGWGAAGFGPYNAAPFAFSVPALSAPSALTITNPMDGGSVAAGNSGIIWDADPNALWYHIMLDGPGTNDIDTWVHAATVCPNPSINAICGYDLTLSAGSYSLTMEAWGAAGLGPASTISFDAS